MGPVHRFDHRCDSVWRHQVRTIRAEEAAQARFSITEKHVPVEIHRQVSISQDVKNLIDLAQGGPTPGNLSRIDLVRRRSLRPTSG